MKSKTFINQQNIGIIATLVLTAIGLFSYRSAQIYPENILVNIQDKRANNFVSETDIIDFIQQIGVNNPGIMQLESVNLRRMEEELMAINFIREAQVSRDVKGNLIVDIQQDSPIARIISAKGKQGYVAENNTILPLSENYTSRVLLLTGTGADSLFSETFLENPEAKELIKFIKHINETPFWKAQITQIDLDEKLNIEAYPQLGKQVVEFGQAKGFEMKLKKLKTFYNEIVPKKGWNTYNRVKLQYENQIVCK